MPKHFLIVGEVPDDHMDEDLEVSDLSFEDEHPLRCWDDGEAFRADGEDYESLPPEPLEIVVDEPGCLIPDYADVPLPVMSKKLLKVLQDAGVENIQVFAAVLVDDDGKTISGDHVAFKILGATSAKELVESKTPAIVRLEDSGEIAVNGAMKKRIEPLGSKSIAFYDQS